MATATALLVAAPARAETYDVVIRGGVVIDGAGAPRRAADVGVRAGRIARLGDLTGAESKLEIDARGLFVAPGFINIHDHPEPDAISRAVNMLTQGVTTEIGNPDGAGQVDLTRQAADMARGGLATNLGLYIGFNSVWSATMGAVDRRPTATEIAMMRGQVDDALKAGAWGVSAGLDYKPGYHARSDEVVRIVSVARGWRTNFPNHERVMPETGFSGLAGARETVDIALRAGMAPVFTHMKVQGAEQGRSGEIFEMMREVRAAGQYAAGDIYPYTFGFNNVRSLMIPAWALDGGEDALYARFADPMQRARIAAEIDEVITARWNGPGGVYVSGLRRELTDIMAEWQVGAGEAIIRLNEQYRGRLPQTYLRFGVESDMAAMLRHPDFAVSCDCGALGAVAGHPRAFGTFPLVLRRYVREEKALSWEEAIRKMTALPAAIIGMVDRGIVAPGMAADLVVFDPATITDRGTDDAPQLAHGVRHVLVNGRLALSDGQPTGNQGGQIVRRSANMPTRPFRLLESSISGAALLDSGARLTVALSPSGRGRVTVTDARGRRVFASDALGVVQVKSGWASVTGEGRVADGRRRAFTLILDGDAAAPIQTSSVVLDVSSEPGWRGSGLGTIRLPR